MLNNVAYSANNQSQNKFAIRVESVPNGNPKKDDGLSDGAIAAIALEFYQESDIIFIKIQKVCKPVVPADKNALTKLLIVKLIKIF